MELRRLANAGALRPVARHRAQGTWSLRSRLETVALGLFGIALLNILRIAVIAVVAYLFGAVPAILVHDYGSIFATVAYLVLFWAFAYEVVLRTPADHR